MALCAPFSIILANVFDHSRQILERHTEINLYQFENRGSSDISLRSGADPERRAPTQLIFGYLKSPMKLKKTWFWGTPGIRHSVVEDL